MLSLFSALAVKIALDELLPAFTTDTATSVDTVFDPTTVLLKKIDAGARPDLLIAVTDAVISLGENGIIDSASIIPLAKTGVGVAVAPSVEVPDISTVDKLRAALTSARSVAYSRTGASGIYFASLLEHLGIAAEVNARATVVEKGFTALAVLDGRADVAIQQLSELRFVPEARIVGPLPEDVQHYSEFSIALGSAAPTGAKDLLDFLSGQSAMAAYLASGLTPGQGR